MRDKVSIATKMAANLAETWKSCASSAATSSDDIAEDYVKSEAYSNILNMLSVCKDGTCVQLRGNSSELRLCRLGDTDLAVLVRTLAEDGGVRELDMSYNTISDSGIEPLCNYLKDPACSMTTLHLSHNNFTEYGAQLLANSLQFNCSVVSLDVSGCKIGRNGGVQLAAMLQVNRTLTSLGLAYTDIDTDVIIAMATVLHGNQTLKSIDLSRPLLHSHQEESTIHISRMLEMNVTLKELKLSWHSMTDTGCECLCRHLKHNTSLTLLDISSNKLSRDGGGYLADLLKANTPLADLNISCNHINDHGLSYISSALQTNTRLTSLNVCYNGAGDVGLCKLATCLLNHNTTLTQLFIWGNKLGTPTANAFRELIEMERLEVDNIDVVFYIVDDITHLARSQHQAY